MQNLFKVSLLKAVRPFVLPSVWAFSFSKFWHGARNPYEVWRNAFCPPNWGNGPKMGQKQGFLNLLKNLAIDFHLICSIMNREWPNNSCFVPPQIPYLEKFWFLRSESECSQPVRLQDF